MLQESKPKIQLKMMSTDLLNENIETDVEKKRGKRGRPRKIQIIEEIVKTSLPSTLDNNMMVLQQKKRGRKKKQDAVYSVSVDNPKVSLSQTPFSSFLGKNYIVQLKVKSNDLEKIQKEFMNQTQQIGYRPLSLQRSFDHIEVPSSNHLSNLSDLSEKSKEHNFDEYYKLLNNLELPLSIPDIKQKMNVCFENQLPEIPNVYQNILVPVLPENVPIHLFNETEPDTINDTKMKSRNQKLFRNTTNILLPLFDNCGNQWPEQSPYACWNCDEFFDGAPMGCPEKEVDGKFYCYGNFCDFSCTARYMDDRLDSVDFWNQYSLLCIIYQKAYNLQANIAVPIAPPPESRLRCGGTLSDDEYHQASKDGRIVEIYKLPLIPVLLHIEEISRSTNINNLIQKNQNLTDSRLSSKKSKKNHRFIPIDPLKLSQAEENIKQKTYERLQSNYSCTLDNCFGQK